MIVLISGIRKRKSGLSILKLDSRTITFGSFRGLNALSWCVVSSAILPYFFAPHWFDLTGFTITCLAVIFVSVPLTVLFRNRGVIINTVSIMSVAIMVYAETLSYLYSNEQTSFIEGFMSCALLVLLGGWPFYLPGAIMMTTVDKVIVKIYNDD